MTISLMFTRREEFLNQLTSGSGYKRYGGSPLRYAGGKSLAVGHILEYLPDGVTSLVSPFIGGASVEIACANELGIDVLGYDIFSILVNYCQATPGLGCLMPWRML